MSQLAAFPSIGSYLGLEKLEVLRKTGRNLPFVLDIRPFPNMRKVDVSDSLVVFNQTLSLCRNNIQLAEINLSKTDIRSFPTNILDDCHNLRSLNLSHNNIEHIDRSFRETMDKLQTRNGLTLDLTGNTFVCHCHQHYHETAAFIGWIKTTDVTIVNKQQLICSNLNGIEVLVDKDENAYADLCSTWDEIILAICVTATSCFCLVFVTTMGFLISKYRYTLKTMWYKLLLAIGKEQPQRYTHDVYIASCPEDRYTLWELVDVLEKEYRFKCCVRERNPSAVGVAADEVEEGIETSATTVVLLSAAAVDDVQHQFERNVARHVEIKRHLYHKVIYVLLDDVSGASRSDVRAVLAAGIAIKWPDTADDDEKIKFFKKLSSKIYKRLWLNN